MDLVLEKASVLCYRLYDVADEDRSQGRRVSARPGRTPAALQALGAEFLLLPNPPLIIGLGRRRLPLPGGPVEVEARARLFDFRSSPSSSPCRCPGNGAGRLTRSRTGSTTDRRWTGARAGRDPAQGSRSGHGEPASLGAGGALRGHLRRAIRGGPSGEDVLGRADLARLLLGETTVQLSVAERRTSPAPLQLWQGRPGGHRLERPSSTSRRVRGHRTSWRSRTPSYSSSATTTTRSTSRPG